ncbi:MAG: universal stress protein, partial [Candidatus Methanoperedens sp.]|nr:universal stress protein [Candidatus Methanoperedens sp.]
MAKFQFLVPVDGSENSKAAARHAVKLAGKYGAEISSMFVADTHKYVAPDILEIVKDAGREYVDQVRKLAESEGITVRSTKVLSGSPIEQILNEANAIDANLIIMAATGHVKTVPIGTVANRVLRLSNSHVLLVRDTENGEHYKKILIPTDGSKDAVYAAQFGMSIARRYNAEVYACTIIDSREKIVERHVATLDEVGRGRVLGETRTYSESIIRQMRKRLLDDAARIADEVRKIAEK